MHKPLARPQDPSSRDHLHTPLVAGPDPDWQLRRPYPSDLSPRCRQKAGPSGSESRRRSLENQATLPPPITRAGWRRKHRFGCFYSPVGYTGSRLGKVRNITCIFQYPPAPPLLPFQPLSPLLGHVGYTTGDQYSRDFSWLSSEFFTGTRTPFTCWFFSPSKHDASMLM